MLAARAVGGIDRPVEQPEAPGCLGGREQLAVSQAAHGEVPFAIALDAQADLVELECPHDAGQGARVGELGLARGHGGLWQHELQAQLLAGELRVEVGPARDRRVEHARLVHRLGARGVGGQRPGEPVGPGRVGAAGLAHALDRRAHRRPVAGAQRRAGEPAQGLVARARAAGLAGPLVRIGQQPAHAAGSDLRPDEAAVCGPQRRADVGHARGGLGRIGARQRGHRNDRDLARGRALERSGRPGEQRIELLRFEARHGRGGRTAHDRRGPRLERGLEPPPQVLGARLPGGDQRAQQAVACVGQLAGLHQQLTRLGEHRLVAGGPRLQRVAAHRGVLAGHQPGEHLVEGAPHLAPAERHQPVSAREIADKRARMPGGEAPRVGVDRAGGVAAHLGELTPKAPVVDVAGERMACSELRRELLDACGIAARRSGAGLHEGVVGTGRLGGTRRRRGLRGGLLGRLRRGSRARVRGLRGLGPQHGGEADRAYNQRGQEPPDVPDTCWRLHAVYCEGGRPDRRP